MPKYKDIHEDYLLMAPFTWPWNVTDKPTGTFLKDGLPGSGKTEDLIRENDENTMVLCFTNSAKHVV